MRKVLLFFMLFLMCGPLFAQNEITWFGDVMEIPGPAKYARMVLMKQGPKAGQILLTYQKFTYGRKIVKRYSSDDGVTWSRKVYYCKRRETGRMLIGNIIELTDGRLLMTYQKLKRGRLLFYRKRSLCMC